MGPGLGVGLLGQISHEEGHFPIDHDCHEESGNGFGTRPEFGPGEVPEDLSVGGEGLGSMPFPEEEGFDVEVEGGGGGGGRRRVEGVVEEVEVEGPTH